MIELKTDAVDAAAGIADLADALDRGIENGVERVAERYQTEKVENIGGTYRRSPTLRPISRRPMWEQTEEWLKGQVIQALGRFERVVTTIGKASKPIKDHPDGYEQKLATLPVSKDGVDRQNAAAPDAEKTITPQVQDLFDSEIYSALDS